MNDIIISILGSTISACIGGLFSFKIAQLTFVNNTKIEITPLILELRVNKSVIENYMGLVDEFSLEDQDSINSICSKIIGDSNFEFGSMIEIWRNVRAQVILNYPETVYQSISEIVDDIESLYRKQRDLKLIEDNANRVLQLKINSQRISDLIRHINTLFIDSIVIKFMTIKR